jgi:hypothetical protein
MVEGMNLAWSHLSGYVAARADANRAHLIENIKATTAILRDDLNAATPEAGAVTEAFLIGVGDLVQLLCEQIGGDEPRRQIDALAAAHRGLGERINAASAAHTPVPIPGWDSAQCPGCGEPVFEREAHNIVMTNEGQGLTAAAYHPQCAPAQ